MSDRGFTLTKESVYLKSLLNPENGPATIPDETNTRHILKSNLISDTLDVQPYTPMDKTANFVYVFFPMHAGSYVGVLYACNLDETDYTFIKAVKTDQVLEDNFDMGRVQACSLLLQLNSTSIALVPLSGAVNAATTERPLNELGLEGPSSEPAIPPYDRILGTIDNPMDKAGSIKLWEGVRVLGLPNQYDQPLDRLNDDSSIKIFSGEVNDKAANIIIDETNSLVVTGGVVAVPTASAGQSVFQLCHYC